MSNEKPVRGEVWDVDLDPVLGHEQGRKRRSSRLRKRVQLGPQRPGNCSADNVEGRSIRSQVAIEAGEAGLTNSKFRHERGLAVDLARRMSRRRGMVSPETMEKVEYCMRVILGI